MGIEIIPPGPSDPTAPAASVINQGAVTAPAANTVIVAVTPTVPGVYQVVASFAFEGTVTTADEDNIKLVVNSVTKSFLTAPPAASPGGGLIQYTLNIAWTTGTIALRSINAGSVAAIYSGTIVATQVG
jgi:hypothetical protein